MARRYNARSVKIHQTYSMEEAAEALSVSIPTIRNWVKAGLPIMKSQRPFLIAGFELRGFIEKRLARSKRKLATGEFYCLRCNASREPFGMMADYIPTNGRKT
jgi:hypothetical protein